MRYYLTEEQVNRLEALRESEWNYHVSRDGMPHDLKPYGSDTKYMMPGRETGHFGSGTYFSTYKDSDFAREYDDSYRHGDKTFINVGGKIYRVDFDLYKNLYRVKSERQGHVLYTLCRKLNSFYSKIFFSKNYDNSANYQYIKANAEALGLKCPSYYQLTRMAQNHNGAQSFSTLFMEMNGYNGVNVSGIDYYDNTKHGSVIYDLSKTSSEFKEIPMKFKSSLLSYQPYDNTLAYDEFDDLEMSALKGNTFWFDEIGKLPKERVLRLFKNYTASEHILPSYVLSRLDEDMLRRYLRILWNDLSRDIIDDIFFMENKDSYVKAIEKARAYYYANLKEGGYYMLVELLNYHSLKMDWDLSPEEELADKKAYVEKLLSYMTRDLERYEKEYIEDYLDIKED